MSDFDWNLVRSFVAVGETGSLSAAARQLRSSQPTVGRHIDELERAFGSKLFLRGRRGYELSEAGAALMARARTAAEAMSAVSLQAAGRVEQLAGTVRISASEMISAFALPAIIEQLGRTAPEIQVEVVATDQVENLLRRDADIAIRMVRPTQQELVAKKLMDIPLQLCAATTYLNRRGRPQVLAEILDHDLVGFDRSDLIIKGFAAFGQTIQPSAFRFRTDSQIVYWQAVRAGNGIGFAQAPIIATDPLVELLLPDFSPPPLPVWLAMHRDVHTSARLRRVADVLEEGLRRYAAG